MTVKEIAEAVGKNPATVARWVEKTSRKVQEISRKVQEAKATSKPADYTLEETCSIIEAGMGANAAGIFRVNAERGNVPATLESTDDELDRAFKLALVSLTNMVNGLDSRVSNIEEKTEKRQSLLPAPGKSSRAELSEMVRKIAYQIYSNDFRLAWRSIYKELYYRCHVNVTTRAKNEGVKPLDIIEREGLTEIAISIAVDILSNEAA